MDIGGKVERVDGHKFGSCFYTELGSRGDGSILKEGMILVWGMQSLGDMLSKSRYAV